LVLVVPAVRLLLRLLDLLVLVVLVGHLQVLLVLKHQSVLVVQVLHFQHQLVQQHPEVRLVQLVQEHLAVQLSPVVLEVLVGHLLGRLVLLVRSVQPVR